MIPKMIRQWTAECIAALRLAATRSTTLDEILFGAILAFVLLMILTLMGLFD
jgi:hypothetical protein